MTRIQHIPPVFSTMFILFFALLAFPGASQKIHSPQEIIRILESSPVAYEMIMLEDEISAPDRTEQVVLHNYYRKEQEGELRTYAYQISSDGAAMLESAEKHFAAKDFAKARSYYEKILQADPGFHIARTYIGQTYGIEGDFKKAIKWYEGAIDKNFIDYMAHWFLADACLKTKKLDKAVDHITIAHILNRNNPRLRASLDRIYKEKGLGIEDWHFNPQMRIDSTGELSVAIYFHPDWLGYALVKAIWRYEPGYAESMGSSPGEAFSMIQEREALASLIAGMEEEKMKDYPEIEALVAALQMDMAEEFIIFEILLPQFPHVANQLPEEMFGRISKYVLKIRGKAK